jgi:hypothetical protein
MKNRNAWAGFLSLLSNDLGHDTTRQRRMSLRPIVLRFPAQIRNKALVPQRCGAQRAILVMAERRFLVR